MNSPALGILCSAIVLGTAWFRNQPSKDAAPAPVGHPQAVEALAQTGQDPSARSLLSLLGKKLEGTSKAAREETAGSGLKKESVPSGNLISAEVGWSARLPAGRGWDTMSAEDRERMNAAGARIIESQMDGPIDTNGLKELINLRKDRFNSFLSTIQPYNEAENGSWHENQANLVNLIRSSYESTGVNLGRFETGTVMLDGLEFATLTIELLHPHTGDVLMTQRMITRLINGYDFSMTLNTGNDEDLADLMTIVKSSTFKQRN